MIVVWICCGLSIVCCLGCFDSVAVSGWLVCVSCVGGGGWLLDVVLLVYCVAVACVLLCCLLAEVAGMLLFYDLWLRDLVDVVCAVGFWSCFICRCCGDCCVNWCLCCFAVFGCFALYWFVFVFV